MARQIFIGLVTEGPTDNRFLESVVRRAFEDVAFECYGDIDVYLKILNVPKTHLSFIDFVKSASQKGIDEIGIMTLCIHADADDKNVQKTYTDKIEPARQHLRGLDTQQFCSLLTPVVPVQMMEAWMLADKELLKREIGTVLSDSELGINRHPESLADPKEVINAAIRIAQAGVAKRRRRLAISELYLPIGQKISMHKLEQLDSFRRFKDEIRDTYKALGYMA